MKKSFLAITLVVTMMATLVMGNTVSHASENAVTITLNGTVVESDVAAYINEDGRTMVPVRLVSEALGASVDWDEVNRQVTITKEGVLLTLTIDETSYKLDDQEMTMDTAPVIVDGRTMVPVRFVSEALGINVGWNATSYTVVLSDAVLQDTSYTIVTTGQESSYDNEGNVITPSEGDDYYGQDADYASAEFSFTTNGDGTVTDNNSGLMWQAVPSNDQMTYAEAVEYCENLVFAGYDDWRIPTTKEMFNLSDFSTGWPFLDQDYFDFPTATTTDMPGGDGGPQGGMPAGADKEAGASLLEGDSGETEAMMPPPPSGDEASDDGSVAKGQGQFWTDYYAVTTDEAFSPAAFGVNHATGHIKAYPAEVGGNMGKYVRAVRGDATAVNDFVDQGDGTVIDEATGLMWMQDDAGLALEWDEALAYAEAFDYAGYDDWRLPDVKELQSIVDYSGVYPAIDQSVFTLTELEDNEFYYYWTNTSAYFSTDLPGYGYAWYVAFGYAVDNEGNDTHGAGGVRFSPKYTESTYAGEGGDNILNSVRLVRTVD